MMCVCLSRQCTMRLSKHFLHLFSVRSLHDVNSRKISAQSAQVSESDLTVMHQLGPISTSLALDDARRASLATSYTLVAHA